MGNKLFLKDEAYCIRQQVKDHWVDLKYTYFITRNDSQKL